MRQIKKIFILHALLLLLIFRALATPPDEGMWIPLLLQSLNEADMKAKGFKLSAEDIYSINKASMKDAVVLFGGGCTGELISGEGLLLTNHHCGYGSVQALSSVDKDYLTDGYWAMNRGQELACKGLSVTFIVKIEDVTAQVLQNVTTAMTETERQSMVKIKIEELQKKAVEGTNYGAVIKPFFYGAEYYLFITETFTDIRLVGTPPSSIGKFGGDTDNWMWPRHTGDFSMFRIYANKENKPADYSPENIPYKPRYFFPISLKGVKENDFTMVMGFPGRTQEYLTSYAVKLLIENLNPFKIRLRENRLKIIDEAMKTSAELRIQYSAKQASIANAWKKWIGENRGLKNMDAVGKKQALETQFSNWVNENADRKQKYGTLLSDFELVYQELAKINLANDYMNEAIFGNDLMTLANAYYQMKFTKDERDRLLARHKTYFKDYNITVDKKLFALCLKTYYQDIDKSLHPAFFKSIETDYNNDFDKYADFVYNNSILVSKEKSDGFINNYTDNSKAILEKDPAFQIISQCIDNYFDKIQKILTQCNAKIDVLQRTYIQGLREMQTSRKFYPDANLTLRVTYGNVKGYEPMNGVNYQYYTTLEGIVEKGMSVGEYADYEVPKKLIELYKNKDYGQYGMNNTMPVCFIASNHTTGGNSGSPVLNAEGQLLGANFDRNWEGTMSDIMYDIDKVRNITVDIRYILFILDKFAGAGHLVKEMKIIK